MRRRELTVVIESDGARDVIKRVKIQILLTKKEWWQQVQKMAGNRGEWRMEIGRGEQNTKRIGEASRTAVRMAASSTNEQRAEPGWMLFACISCRFVK